MPLLAIAVVSASVLAYEVLLARLFSIVQWYHFAYMVISIALLGYGVSGTVLTLVGRWLERRFHLAFGVSAALFGVFAVLAFALAQTLPFNALELVWDPRQLLYLSALYALFVVPFLFGASCVGLAFRTFRDRIGRLYHYDLLGAGAGALGIVLLLFALSPDRALVVVGGLGVVASGLAALKSPRASARPLAVALIAIGFFAPWAVPSDWIALRISEYKGLSQTLRVPGTRVIGESSSPLGLLTVVESATIPFRHAPGLSLNNTVEPPAQLGVFTDGDGLSVITRYDGRHEPLAYLDFTTAALPYHLLERPRVLILGAGGGADVLRALTLGAARIDAVELNRDFARLVSNTHATFAGDLYADPRVTLHIGEARGFVAAGDARYDLIQIPLLDSFAAAAGGGFSLSESYVYTVEALATYLGRLRVGGMLAITRWLKLPPRDSLKLFATAIAALEEAGIEEAGRHLALIRSWKTTTLLIKTVPFVDDEVAALRAFAQRRSFDVAHYPGMPAAEANRYNLLSAPDFFAGAQALLAADREDFNALYKFDIAPATDDRPYFFDFFRWKALPELLTLRTQGGAALLEWGYPILFATLLQAALFSAVLILAPLWRVQRRAGEKARLWPVALYFLTLGFAFLFIEIAFIQRFILFLSHPLYALAVVLASFLIFAGIGSGCAPRLARRLEEMRRAGDGLPAGDGARARLAALLARRSAVEVAVAGIVITAALYLILLPVLFEALIALPDIAKIAIALALIAPLAFWMGMPFPLGLERVGRHASDMVAWAWGINGCASVLSAVLTTILAIHLGFTVVVALAALLYASAAALYRLPLACRSP